MPCSSWTMKSPSAISAQIAERRRLAAGRASRSDAGAEDLLLGDDDQAVGRQREPAPQRPDQHRQRGATRASKRTDRPPRRAWRTVVARPDARSSAASRSACIRLEATTGSDARVEPAAQPIAQRLADVDLVFVPGVLGARLPQLGAQRGVRRRFDPHARRRVGRLVEAGDLRPGASPAGGAPPAPRPPPPRPARTRAPAAPAGARRGGRRPPRAAGSPDGAPPRATASGSSTTQSASAGR